MEDSVIVRILIEKSFPGFTSRRGWEIILYQAWLEGREVPEWGGGNRAGKKMEDEQEKGTGKRMRRKRTLYHKMEHSMFICILVEKANFSRLDKRR